MTKDKSEIVDVTVRVKISYSSPEMREKAIECAQKELWLEMWLVGLAGSYSAKVVRK